MSNEQPGYVRDVEELLETYSLSDAVDFTSFRNLWRTRNFTFIHEGRPKEMNQQAYQQILYSAALGFLGEDKPLSLRVGVMYTLYTLYETQPAQPKILIYLSTADVMQMRALLQQIRERQLADAFQVMRKLVMENLFLYGAVACSAPAAMNRITQLAEQSKKKIMRTREKLLGPLDVKSHFEISLTEKLAALGEVEKWAAEYATARDKALAGSMAIVLPGSIGAGSSLPDEIRERAAEWDKERAAALKRLLPSRPARPKQKISQPAQTPPEAAAPRQQLDAERVFPTPAGAPPGAVERTGPEWQGGAEREAGGVPGGGAIAEGRYTGAAAQEAAEAMGMEGGEPFHEGEDLDMDANPQSMPKLVQQGGEGIEQGSSTDEEDDDEVARIEQELFGDAGEG